MQSVSWIDPGQAFGLFHFREDSIEGAQPVLPLINNDSLVKSQKTSFFVIPAKAGIQCFQKLMTDLDPGFRRGDDFLRGRQ